MYNERNYIEFTTLEQFGEWLGYAFPEELRIVAAVEGWRDSDGAFDKASINDTLRRMHVKERCTHCNGSFILE